MPSTFLQSGSVAVAAEAAGDGPNRTPPAGPGEPAAVIAIRAGDHPDFGRLVFDTNTRVSYHLSRDGDRVTIQFPDASVPATTPPPPRNVRSLRVSGPVVEVTLAPGTTIRDSRMGGRIVLDVFDPTPPPTGTSAAPAKGKQASEPSPGSAVSGGAAPVLTPAAAPPPNGKPPASRSSGTPAVAAPTVTVPAAAAPAPAAAPPSGAPKVPLPDPGETREAQSPPAEGTGAVSPHPRTADAVPAAVPGIAAGPDVPAGVAPPPVAGPIALAARRDEALPASNDHAVTLPFGAGTGAAMFSRGNSTFIVFDERRPIDLAPLRGDPVFGPSHVRLLPGGTLFHLTLPAGYTADLSPAKRGWTITARTEARTPRPIVPASRDGAMTFTVDQPSGVVSLADPDTGATFLVGTQRRAGQGVVTERRTAEFGLPATQLGVVVEPLSETIALRSIPGGFILTGGATGLALSSPASTGDAALAAALLTRRFEFPNQATDALARTLGRQIAEAGSAPARARGPKRRAAAATMLSLGMGVEAEALLRLAAAQDPNEAGHPDAVGLGGIAALMAGRLDRTDGLADIRLDGTDDMVLWRALRQAAADEASPQAAAALARTAPLLFVYPPAVRARFLPSALETMIQGGEADQASRWLTQRPDDTALDFARALLARARGDTAAAIERFDTLAQSRDQLTHARAAWRAIELRLETGKIEPPKAVEALSRLLYAWRGDQRDLSLRLRIAELLQSTGGWRPALAALRSADADFPAQSKMIRERLRETFAALTADDAVRKLAPLDFVMILEENTDLVPSGTAAEAQLADRLLALDLPKRADSVLTKLMRAAATGPGKAGIGIRLATVRLREGDPSGALAALAESAAPDLPRDVEEARNLLAAAATARRGDPRAAISLLGGSRSVAAHEARASILEQAGDWAGAEAALIDYAAALIPDSGPLDDQHRRALLRLASAAARAGDEATLTAIRQREQARIGDGPLADMFRLLTAEPVLGAGDLVRAKREAGLAQALPAGLTAYQTPEPRR